MRKLSSTKSPERKKKQQQHSPTHKDKDKRKRLLGLIRNFNGEKWYILLNTHNYLFIYLFIYQNFGEFDTV